MDPTLLDTDYLIASFGQTTGLSRLTDGAISHDQITRLLATPSKTGADLWLSIKALVRQIESDDGVLIFDDTIEEKPYTDENDIISWHWHHSKNRNVKGGNLITVLYQSTDAQTGVAMSIPVSFDLVEKTEFYTDKKTGKPRRRSPTTKNERFRSMLSAGNRISYVLADTWFARAEKMRYCTPNGTRTLFFRSRAIARSP